MYVPGKNEILDSYLSLIPKLGTGISGWPGRRYLGLLVLLHALAAVLVCMYPIPGVVPVFFSIGAIAVLGKLFLALSLMLGGLGILFLMASIPFMSVSLWSAETPPYLSLYHYALASGLGAAFGYILCMVFAFRDQLNQSKQDFQHLTAMSKALISSNSDCIKVLGKDAELLTINQSGIALLEARNKLDVLHRNWLDFFSGQDREKAGRAWDRAWHDGYGEFTGTCPTLTGRSRVWYNVLTPIEGGPYNARYMLVVSRDITRDHKAQRASKALNVELSHFLNSVHHPFLACDADGEITYLNAEAENVFSCDAESLIGRKMMDVLPQSLGLNLQAWYHDVGSEGKRRTRRVENEENGRWYDIDVHPKPNGMNLMLIDVTNDMRDALRLDHERARCSIAQELESLGDWEYDTDTGALQLSAQAWNVLGVPPTKIANITGSHYDLVAKHFSASERLRLTQALLAASRSAEKSSLHVELVRSTGETIHLAVSMCALRDVKGKPIKIIGSVQDRSDQQNREARLASTEKFVRGVINALPSEVCVVNRDGRALMMNKNWRVRASRSNPVVLDLPDGGNYLSQSRNLFEHGDVHALATLQGLSAVIEARKSEFTYEYLLDDAGTTRRFVLKVRPMLTEGDQEAELYVLSHEEITEQCRVLAKNDTSVEGHRDGHSAA